MSEITEKVVIITGASSGLGEATARRLAKNGARLMLAARRTVLLSLPLKQFLKALGLNQTVKFVRQIYLLVQ
jgi:NADP-dependent 3-hydroxy acid dehydrogenase YdfG